MHVVLVQYRSTMAWISSAGKSGRVLHRNSAMTKRSTEEAAVVDGAGREGDGGAETVDADKEEATATATAATAATGTAGSCRRAFHMGIRVEEVAVAVVAVMAAVAVAEMVALAEEPEREEPELPAVGTGLAWSSWSAFCRIDSIRLLVRWE